MISLRDLGYDTDRDDFELWFAKAHPNMFRQDRLREKRHAMGGYWEPNPDGDKATPINTAWGAWLSARTAKGAK